MTSRLDDARDPTVAAQLAQQSRVEDADFYTAFRPYSAPSSPEGVAPTSLDATALQGKGIFDSHGCSGCHGASGGGAVGPALTHISSQYPPAQLAAILKAPTPSMKAAGMVPLTLNSDEMKGLVSYLSGLGGGSAASAGSPTASVSASPAPAEAESSATAGVSKAPTGSPAVDSNTAQGKGIFESQRCSGCHGASGGGGVGPALTHIASQYPPAKLSALLKAPTAKMKAAGMVPLTLNAADMKALVDYVTGLGGTSAASGAAPPVSGSPSTTKAKVEQTAKAGVPKVASATASPVSVSASPIVVPLELHISLSAGPSTASVSSPPAPAEAQSGATAETSKTASAQASPESVPSSAAPADAKPSATVAQGKGIFESQRCSGCHGASGGGGVGPALTHIASQYPPAKLSALLKAPTAKMKAAGMVPLTLNAADMKALVDYVTGLGGTSAASGAAPPVSGTPSPATAKAKPPAAAGPSIAESKGRVIFEAHGCVNCHGTDGVVGTAAAPPLAGTGTSLAPAVVTTMLQHPTARMQQGGMPPVSLDDDELKALVAYLRFISASKSNAH